MTRRDLFKLLLVAPLTKLINKPKIYFSRVYGIPYHYNDATTSKWLGIERAPVECISSRDMRIPLRLKADK